MNMPMPPMPMGGPPGGAPGGMPPGLMGGTGGATMPTPMKPQALEGVAGVKASLELLQKSLATLPLGSDLHASVLKAVTDISKHIGGMSQDVSPQDQIQQLVAAARAAQTGGSNPLAAMMPPGGGAPGGGMPPPPPPPMGGPDAA